MKMFIGIFCLVTVFARIISMKITEVPADAYVVVTTTDYKGMETILAICKEEIEYLTIIKKLVLDARRNIAISLSTIHSITFEHILNLIQFIEKHKREKMP